MGGQDVQAGFVSVEQASVVLGNVFHRAALGKGRQDNLITAGLH